MRLRGVDGKKGIAGLLPTRQELSKLTRTEIEAFVAGYLDALSGAGKLDRALRELGRPDLAHLVNSKCRGSKTTRSAISTWHKILKEI